MSVLSGEAEVSDWGLFARRLVIFGFFGLVLSYAAGATDLGASFLGRAAIFALIGLSLNILMGYAGQISLGHNAFVGVGAFAASFLTAKQGLPMYISIPMAAAIGGITSVILGAVALRIRGLYLALITLAYGLMVERSIFEITELTGGGAGTQVFRPEPFVSDNVFTFVCFAVLGIIYYLDWRMMSTKFGRALLAMKSNEQVAASLGMNPVFYKLAAFIMAGTIAGLAGGLLAFNQQLVVSQDFTFATALTYVIMVVVGGLGQRLGAVIGSFLIAYLVNLLEVLGRFLENDSFPEFLQTFGGGIPISQVAITSLLLLLTITLYPGGIYQQLEPVWIWLSGKPFPRHHGHDDADPVQAEASVTTGLGGG